jgi:hypothetical protein
MDEVWLKTRMLPGNLPLISLILDVFCTACMGSHVWVTGVLLRVVKNTSPNPLAFSIILLPCPALPCPALPCPAVLVLCLMPYMICHQGK